MIYQYEKACKEAGLAEEKIQEIRNMFNTEYQKLHRQKKAMENSDYVFLNAEGMRNSDGEYWTHEIPDPTVNVEDEIIHKMDLERLNKLLDTLPIMDKEFLLDYFSGENKFLDQMAAKYKMTRNQVIVKKRKLILALREKF